MKKLIVFICLIVVGINTQAQSNYQKGMSKGMEMLKSAKTAEDFLNVSNHFERVSNVEKEEWAPIYWNAYVTMIAAMNADKESKQDELYDKALLLVEKLEGMKMDESEFYTLKAYITLMRISVSPMTRAPLGTPAAMEMLAKAQNLNPTNPRPFYVQGQNTFYTPEFFGGGKKVAKPILDKAVKLYAEEKPSEDFSPRWGKSRAEQLLKQCE